MRINWGVYAYHLGGVWLAASYERRTVREHQNQKYAYGHGASPIDSIGQLLSIT